MLGLICWLFGKSCLPCLICWELCDISENFLSSIFGSTLICLCFLRLVFRTRYLGWSICQLLCALSSVCSGYCQRVLKLISATLHRVVFPHCVHENGGTGRVTNNRVDLRLAVSERKVLIYLRRWLKKWCPRNFRWNKWCPRNLRWNI